MSGLRLDSKIDLNSDEAKAWLAHNCGLAEKLRGDPNVRIIESCNLGCAA